MKLTNDNYHSSAANHAYWSASFVKEMLDCPAKALARLREDYEEQNSTALLVGSYVDAHFEGSLPKFKEQHPGVFTMSGTLRAEYRKAEEMIAKAESDPVFMEFMRGEKQRIITGKIGGIPFKAKLDVYLPGKRIVDVKTAKDMEPKYREGEGKLCFADYWRWPLQMAIYQYLEGHNLPCYLAVITKENPPDIAVIEIPQATLDAEMNVLLEKLPLLDAMRSGVIDAEWCGRCEWCRKSKKLTGAVSLDVFQQI